MTNRHKSLVFFIVSVVGIGWLIGVTNLPGAWYAGLTKASFNPPNWIFGPIWTVIYVLIAIAGWRTYLQETPAALPMQLWYVQMALNFIWSPVVFTLHSLGLGSQSSWRCLESLLVSSRCRQRTIGRRHSSLYPMRPGSPLRPYSITRSIA